MSLDRGTTVPLLINDVVQISYRGLSYSQRIINVTTWKVTASASNDTDQADLTSILAVFRDAGAAGFLDRYLDCLGAEYQLSSVRAQRIWPLRTSYVQSLGTGEVGKQATQSENPTLTAAISRITGAAGRDQISTSHIGPGPAAEMIDGLWSPAYRATVEQWAIKFLTNVNTAAPVISLEPVVFHSRAVNPSAQKLTAIHQFNTVRTMSRRVVGRGE